jgi:putative ABC transport system permease protein
MPTGWRITARIVRRELLAHKLSSGLLVAVVALPLLVAVTYLGIRQTSQFTDDARLHRALGTASLRVSVVPSASQTLKDAVDASGTRVKAAMPGDRTELLVQVPGVVRLGDRDAAVDLRAATPSPELINSTLAVESGRWPASDHEIAISGAVANRLGVVLGGQVDVPALGAGLTVVGVLDDPIDTTTLFAVVPATTSALTDLSAQATAGSTQISWFGQVAPDDVTAVRARLESFGWSVLDTRGVLDRAVDELPIASLGVLAAVLVEAGLIAASGFVVISQRLRGTLGLLAVVGADPRQRRRVGYTLGGMVGLTALVVAVPLGVLGEFLAVPVLADRAGQLWGTPVVPWPLVALACAMVVCTALVSAVLVGRGLTRESPMAALRGRVEITPLRRRFWLAAALLGGGAVLAMAVGLAADAEGWIGLGALLAIAGGGLAIRGALRGCLRLGGRMSLAARLALRHAAMMPSRPVALSTAIAGIVALCTVITSLTMGLAAAKDAYVAAVPMGDVLATSTAPVPAKLVHDVASTLGSNGVANLAPVWDADPATGTPIELAAQSPLQDCRRADHSPDASHACAQRTGIAVVAPGVAEATVEDAETVIGRSLTAAERAAFGSGTALVLNSKLVQNGHVKLVPPQLVAPDAGVMSVGGSGGPSLPAFKTYSVPALTVLPDAQYEQLPLVLVDQATVRAQGLREATQHLTLFTTRTAPTADAEDRARSLLADGMPDTPTLYVERGDATGRVVAVVNGAVDGALILFSVVVAGLAALLSAAELRGDMEILNAVGADPRLRKRLSGAQTSLAAVLGCGLGVPIGLFAGWALLALENAAWSAGALVYLAPAVVILVVVAYLVAYLSTPSRLPTPRGAQ